MSAVLNHTAEATFPPDRPSPSFPYQVLREVGRGGMGVVYQAEDIELGRTIAIKVIRPSVLAELPAGDVEMVLQRFVQEARATAALSHPGVPIVHRVATEGHWPYIAMEWLEGRTLEDRLNGGRTLNVDDTARLGIQILAVLDQAHRAGVVHRDIKPANLMITDRQNLKVMDFGIARVSESTMAAHTQAGTVLGTPTYAAPEQLEGRPVDGRTDLYAVAGVLYEVLAGRPAFEASSIYELMLNVISTAPSPPSVYNPTISAELDALILKGLAKDPNARFQTAREMASALQRFLAAGTEPMQHMDTQAIRAVREAEPTTMLVPGTQTHELVLGVIRTWPASPLGRHATKSLLAKLHERPLHAAAFSGAVELQTACLLVADGIIYAVFDPQTGRLSNDLLETMPECVEPILRALPAGTEPRLIPLLASVLLNVEPRLANLDTSVVDMPKFARKLAAENLDGAIRFTRGNALGLALYNRGECILTLFGDGWPQARAAGDWRAWALGASTYASVEDRATSFPAVTFRHQLTNLAFRVERPTVDQSGSLRTDTLALKRALQLVPEAEGRMAMRRGDSTVRSMLDGDSAFADARWLLVDMTSQFDQYDRASQWKGLVGTLPDVKRVVLHHSMAEEGGPESHVDVAAYDSSDALSHLVRRAALGSVDAVRLFMDEASAVKSNSRGQTLKAAVLIAPSFEEEAIAAYFARFKEADKLGIWSKIDAFNHTQGFLHTKGRAGFHMLLVEETEGRRRPLMPQ